MSLQRCCCRFTIIADTAITLLRRLWNGERIWEAHRTHFYQRATDLGLSVYGIVGRVFAVNVVLAALAIATVWFELHGRMHGMTLRHCWPAG